MFYLRTPFALKTGAIWRELTTSSDAVSSQKSVIIRRLGLRPNKGNCSNALRRGRSRGPQAAVCLRTRKKLRIVIESFEAPRAQPPTARRHGISRSLLMTWRRAFGPEPTSPQGEQSGFARVVLAAEVEPGGCCTERADGDRRWEGG